MTRAIIMGLMVVSIIAAMTAAQFLDQQLQQEEHGRFKQSGQGRLIVADKTGQRAISLSPGILEQSLLKRGSFDFDPKLVQFDKLKVLGNIYVHRINGHNLREHYLLKSNSMPASPPYRQRT